MLVYFSRTAVRLVCFAWLGLTLAALGCGSHPNGSGTDAEATGEVLVRVTPIVPQRKTLVRRTEQPGHIEAFQSSPLLPKVTGYVEQVLVDIGDAVQGPQYADGKLVEPGQVLARIAVPELEEEAKQKLALVDQAQAELRQAEAAVKVARAARDSAAALVGEAKAAVDRAQADFARWESELNRVTQLVATRSVTAKLEDETRNQYQAASAARKEVAAKIDSAQAGLAESEALIEKAVADREAVAARLRVAEADQQRVQTLLGYTAIRAPFDGVVTARNVDTGHLVSTADKQPLLEVVQASVVRIFIDIPEADAIFIQPKNEARIRIPSLGGEPLAAEVTRTSWILASGTRTLRAEIDLANDDGRLRPGMYVYADVKVAERPDVLVIPQTALMTQDGQSYCWQIDAQGTIVRTSVQLGLASNGEVEVTGGLTGSEKLIGVNPTSFREGQRVEVVAPAGK